MMTKAQIELLDRVASACIVFAQYADLDHTAKDIDEKLVAMRLEDGEPYPSQVRDWTEFIEVVEELPTEAALIECDGEYCSEDVEPSPRYMMDGEDDEIGGVPV